MCEMKMKFFLTLVTVVMVNLSKFCLCHFDIVIFRIRSLAAVSVWT